MINSLNIKRNYTNKVSNMLVHLPMNKTYKALLNNYAKNYLNRRFIPGSIVLNSNV